MSTPDDATIRASILDLVGGRETTVCPSEVARALADEDWRDLMPRVREVADSLASEHLIEVTQKGESVSATTARGPIRLTRPRA